LAKSSLALCLPYRNQGLTSPINTMISFKEAFGDGHTETITTTDKNLSGYFDKNNRKAKLANTCIAQKNQTTAVKKDRLNILLNENLK